MRTSIKAFSDLYGEIDVTTSRATQNTPKTVLIASYCGACNFNFHMTADQAREMAAALMACAFDVESKR